MVDQNKNFVDLSNARRDDQRKVLEQIIADGVCPFCPENLGKYHTQPIIKEGKYWLLTPNQWPYVYTKNHYLAIYKTHAENLTDISPEAGAELVEFFQEIVREKNIPGGALNIRFGSNPKLGNYGSSVLHIHAHLIEPDLENPEKAAIKFKIGEPKDRKK
jgi:diadenosine tetraphosphate (Ap4A) HIT family hydrolase